MAQAGKEVGARLLRRCRPLSGRRRLHNAVCRRGFMIPTSLKAAVSPWSEPDAPGFVQSPQPRKACLDAVVAGLGFLPASSIEVEGTPARELAVAEHSSQSQHATWRERCRAGRSYMPGSPLGCWRVELSPWPRRTPSTTFQLVGKRPCPVRLSLALAHSGRRARSGYSCSGSQPPTAPGLPMGCIRTSAAV